MMCWPLSNQKAGNAAYSGMNESYTIANPLWLPILEYGLPVFQAQHSAIRKIPNRGRSLFCAKLG